MSENHDKAAELLKGLARSHRSVIINGRELFLLLPKRSDVLEISAEAARRDGESDQEYDERMFSLICRTFCRFVCDESGERLLDESQAQEVGEQIPVEILTGVLSEILGGLSGEKKLSETA